MSSQQERGTKSASTDSKRTTESHAPEEKVETSKASHIKEKLTVAKHYLMLGLAPAISICALAIAVYAVTQNQSSDDQQNKSKVKIDNLNASLLATKSELEKMKTAVAQINGIQEDVNKKQDERVVKIIQNITPLQVKLKIFPTIEEQLRQAAAASAVAPVVASSVSAASDVTATAEKKLPLPQVKAMKEAIDKYNKNN